MSGTIPALGLSLTLLIGGAVLLNRRRLAA
ncbi:hypothetical protein [Trueperella sp.]